MHLKTYGTKPAMWIVPILFCFLAQGCIWVPTLGTLTGDDAGQKIGGGTSERAIRVGVSSRADVTRVLGEPVYTSIDHSSVIYRWERQWAEWVWPIFVDRYFYVYEADVTVYGVEIEFSPNGTISNVVRHSQKHYMPILKVTDEIDRYSDGKYPASSLEFEFGAMHATTGDPSTRESPVP